MAWSQIIGHRHIVESFARARARGRLGHAYFFVGPSGVGKRRFAIELAKTLLCEQRPSDRFEACDRCPACVQVPAESHPDFFPLRRPPDKANLPVEPMREYLKKLALKPVRGHGKVALIEDGDDLFDPSSHHASANTFLKTLEEPPPGTLIIILGTSIEQQLPTILSRCQLMRFCPLTESEVVSVLQANGVSDPTAIYRAARLSGGSPGVAMALVDPELEAFRAALVSELAKNPFDSVEQSQTWMQFAESAGKESAEQRQRVALAIRLLIDVLNDAVATRLGNDPRASRPDDSPALERLSRLGLDALETLLERCLEADRQVDRRLQLVLAVEGLLDAFAQKLRPPLPGPRSRAPVG